MKKPPEGGCMGTTAGSGCSVHQAFLAQAVHQALDDTCLPANKGHAPPAAPALPWYKAQLPQLEPATNLGALDLSILLASAW